MRDLAKKGAPWLLLIAYCVIVFGPGFYDGAVYSLDPDVMCDDVRIVHFHFFNWMDPALFSNDALGRYHADGTSDLFRAVFLVAAKLGNPYTFTKYVPLVLFPLTLVGIALAARKLAGFGAALVAVTLCVGATLILGRIAGALPRAFAYPILAWMAAALVHGNIRALCALTVLGAGFYPVITVVGGLVLAIVLLVMPPEDRGVSADWSFARRVGWLSGTALACAVLTAPFVLRMRPYGETITPSMLSDYPEAGLGGRQDSVTRPPFAPLVEAWAATAEQAVTTAGDRLVPLVGDALARDPQVKSDALDRLAWLTILGCLSAGLGQNRGMRRLSAMALAVGVAYLLANLVTPRLVVPPRYTLYGVPIVSVLALSAAPSGLVPWKLLDRLPRGRLLGQILVLACSGVLVALLGGMGRPHPGVGRFVKDSDRGLFAAIRQLPPDSLIAGWPEGALETLPIASLRTPFLTRELHVPYHTRMTLTMRRRMEALIFAYYAHEPGPLLRLRDEFSVTHLVVEPQRYQKPSRYFKPFGPLIESAFEEGRRLGFTSLKMRHTAATFDGGRYFVLDLARIP